LAPNDAMLGAVRAGRVQVSPAGPYAVNGRAHQYTRDHCSRISFPPTCRVSCSKVYDVNDLSSCCREGQVHGDCCSHLLGVAEAAGASRCGTTQEVRQPAGLEWHVAAALCGGGSARDRRDAAADHAGSTHPGVTTPPAVASRVHVARCRLHQAQAQACLCVCVSSSDVQGWFVAVAYGGSKWVRESSSAAAAPSGRPRSSLSRRVPLLGPDVPAAPRSGGAGHCAALRDRADGRKRT
jgi:hypothetical protein